MRLSPKVGAGVAAGLGVLGIGFGIGFAQTSGATPQPVQVFTPTGATLSTSTAAQTTTTTATTPTTTVRATPTTTTTPASSPPVYGLVRPAATATTTTTTAAPAQVTVPNVVGDTFGTAQSTITGVGLQPANQSCAKNTVPQPGDIVTATAPPAGNTLPPGGVVTVFC